MARAGRGRRQDRRKQRREFEESAADAIDSAMDAEKITVDQADSFKRALTWPRIREQIRNAFVSDTPVGEIDKAIKGGKIDFDLLSDWLENFFPKLAKLRKFAKLFQTILGSEAAGG